MRKQQQIWEEEHKTTKTLAQMQEIEPSSYVVKFYEYLISHGYNPPLSVVDIGCGKGRNSFYFAKQGYLVSAMDYSKTALSFAETQAKMNHTKVVFLKGDMDATWPYKDNSFDIAIDCFSSIDIETLKGRETYKHELLRTLKPKGVALVVVVSADDELEAELIKTSPGGEPNSTIWPINQKFQKNYSEEELREFYNDFTILELKKFEKQTHKLRRDYTARNYWLILQKKIT